MTQKKKTETPSVEINLDTLIGTLETNKEQLDIKGIEVETLQEEQEELAKELHAQAEQLKVIRNFSTPEQQDRIDGLHLERFIQTTKHVKPRSRGKRNATCAVVLDILEYAEKEMTNEALHHAYLDTFNGGEDALGYTAFNIAIRPLTNDNKVVTRTFVTKGDSRTAIMSLTTKQE